MESQVMRLGIVRLWIEAWTDGFHADGRPYDRVALHIERKELEGTYRPADGGTGRVWFILDRSELDALIAGTQSEFADGYHRMSIGWGQCTFYDLEFPRADAGVMQLRYLRLDLPRAWWKYVARIARFVWKGQRAALAGGASPYDLGRVNLELPLATLDRFEARYGSHKGTVDLELSDRLRTDMASRPQLRDMVERCTNIARGMTRNVYQRARLRITNDLDGYFFQTFAPSGRRGMHGGIVNHARNGADDSWSIHT